MYKLIRLFNGGRREDVGTYATYKEAERALMDYVNKDIAKTSGDWYLPIYDIIEDD